MNITFFRRLGMLALVSVVLSIPFVSVKAMTVSPVRIELSGNPGTSVSGVVKVINDEKEAKTLYTSVENFEALGETGTPNFRPGGDGLASWIKTEKEVSVDPGQTKTINFTVQIPSAAEPGGYFAAIFLGTNPPATNNESQLTIGSRIGSLLLFRVNGNIKENGALLEFGTKNKKTFFNALPVNFYYRFQNSGADRVLPKGTLTIKNIFGSQKVLDPNPTQGNVLPKSIRRFELWWQKNDSSLLASPQPENQGFIEAAKYQWHNFAFGPYTAELNLQYGSKNETATSSFKLFVFPWQLLFIEFIGLLLTIFILRFIVKKYNRWVIKKARS